ncbi:MAG: hypothetical protein RR397_02130 [Odoribacter sp.]
MKKDKEIGDEKKRKGKEVVRFIQKNKYVYKKGTINLALKAAKIEETEKVKEVDSMKVKGEKETKK